MQFCTVVGSVWHGRSTLSVRQSTMATSTIPPLRHHCSGRLVRKLSWFASDHPISSIYRFCILHRIGSSSPSS
jgi:hypothetical protein